MYNFHLMHKKMFKFDLNNNLTLKLFTRKFQIDFFQRFKLLAIAWVLLNIR